MVTQIGVVVGIQTMSKIADGSAESGPYVTAYLVGAGAALVGLLAAGVRPVGGALDRRGRARRLTDHR